MGRATTLPSTTTPLGKRLYLQLVILRDHALNTFHDTCCAALSVCEKAASASCRRKPQTQTQSTLMYED